MLAIRAHSRAAPWQFVRHLAPYTAALPSVQVRKTLNVPYLGAFYSTMLRLLNRKTLKAFRNPLQTRQVHTEQAPFSGPPSYATITRRFSSQPNPVAFFEKKREQEAIKRGEFDIHDIGGVDPEDYDVILTDVMNKTLRHEVAEIAGVPYLQGATEDEANEVVTTGQGFIYGKKLRTIFPCVAGREGRAHWVFFVVDTGAPLTYLSKQVSYSHL